jgi:hypothetical protein
MALIHGVFFKMHMIKEVVGQEHYPDNERIDGLIEFYKIMWPYSFPDFLKNDFVHKMQAIFKKKFVGDDANQSKKTSQQIILDFNFGIIPTDNYKKASSS